MKKVKCPLGEGRAYTFTTSEGGKNLTIPSEIYPWEGKYLCFKLVGTAAGFKKALKDFETARGTLKTIAE